MDIETHDPKDARPQRRMAVETHGRASLPVIGRHFLAENAFFILVCYKYRFACILLIEKDVVACY
jgi:hypothetical protein